LEKGRVVIFACGTGNPFFSTDTAAALRAAEMGADVILLAKSVDGVYNDDPKRNTGAVKYDEINYRKILSDGLMVMDSPATALCMENDIPILVFALSEKNSIVRAVKGENVGTLVKK
jgi:uridylate kinase